LSEPPIPNYVEMMLPTLKAMAELGQPTPYATVDQRAIEIAGLTPEQVAVEYPAEPSQSGPKILHRIAWARTLLKKIGAADNPTRGSWTATDLGIEILSKGDTAAERSLLDLHHKSLEGTEPSDDFFTSAVVEAETGNPRETTPRGY